MAEQPHRADRALRILVVVHAFPPDTWAGTEVYTLGLATELARLGHELTIVTRAPPVADEAEWTLRRETFQGLRVIRVTRRLERLRVRETYAPPEAKAVFERVLDEIAPDVVHVQSILHLSIEWLDVARARGVPYAVTYNDYWAICARVQLMRPNGALCERNQGHGCIVCIRKSRSNLVPLARRVLPALEPFLMRRIARLHPDRWISRVTRDWREVVARHPTLLERFGRAELGIAPSRFLRDKLLETGAFDPKRLVHSMYGMRAPTDVRAKSPRPPGVALRAAFVGSLLPYKGVEALVRAMRRLASEPIDLVVHGDHRPASDAFHAKLAELAAGTRTRFAGRFDNARIGEIHRDVDVLVVPSTWYENSPLSIHEAFQHGTPVVTSDFGGMREAVRHDVDGLRFAVGDDRALADALLRLAREQGLVERLAREAPRVKTLAEDAEWFEARLRELVEAR